MAQTVLNLHPISGSSLFTRSRYLEELVALGTQHSFGIDRFYSLFKDGPDVLLAFTLSVIKDFDRQFC